jgi:hypothetical protein
LTAAREGQFISFAMLKLRMTPAQTIALTVTVAWYFIFFA